MEYSNFHSLVYKKSFYLPMKDLYYAAILVFQAATMTSSISLISSNCVRDCPIGWLLKTEASEKVGELLMVLMVRKALLNLKEAKGGVLPDGNALSEASTVLSTWVNSWLPWSFDMAAPTRLKGGNQYILWGFYLKLIEFTAM